MRLKRRPSLMMTIVLVLMVLMPLLAVLQYRWLAQVSDAERSRMEANLKTSVNRFTEDFDREITRTYFNFNVAKPFTGNVKLEDFTDRYNHWLETAPYPKLISNLYMFKEIDKQVETFKLNKEAKQFESSPLPEYLQTVMRQREKMKELPAVAFALSLQMQPFDEDHPALFLPNLKRTSFEIDTLADHKISKAGKVERIEINEKSRPELHSVLIVEFDIDYIKQELIPLLAERYFSGQDGYDVAVVSQKDPKKTIFKSSPNVSFEKNSKADAVSNLFSVKTDEFKSLAVNNYNSSKDRTSQKRPGVIIEHSEFTKNETTDSGKNSQTRTFSFTTTNSDLSVRIFKHKPGPPDNFLYLREGRVENPWKLLLKHPSGSLETAVATIQRRNLLISFSVLILLGGSMAMLVISTRRAQKLAKQQMEFVSAVSHELRTPLAVICSAAENLSDGVVESQQQIKRYGTLIEEEGRRLAEMVEQVLEFAGTESNRRSYDLRPIDTLELIDGALTTYQRLVEEGGFNLEKDIDKKLPKLLVDIQAISRAIHNLLSNAMKYSGESRWIALRVKAAGSERKPEVQIIVEDKGLGISTEDRAHIFEPFYRGRQAVDAQIQGSGLGLSLVKQIVELHSGRVSVESSLNAGSRFIIHLPAIAETESVANSRLVTETIS
ncbi:MAG: HAMP domain-containing histidine kinase [Blastocatellia bacterium]|nr:HAMP domain-containing histidine kinase [Blastocatellia bacterium]